MKLNKCKIFENFTELTLFSVTRTSQFACDTFTGKFEAPPFTAFLPAGHC